MFMFKKIALTVAILASQSFAVYAKGPISRSCPPCPVNSAQFCNVCADTGVIGNLVVQNSVTLCPGVELPCFCCYNDNLTWGPAEILPQAAAINILAPVPDSQFQPNPSAFQPYVGSNITLRGWEMCSPLNTGCPTAFLTVQFEVPYDMNININPSLFIHFFLPAVEDQSFVRFQVDVELLGFGDDTGAASKSTVLSQNVEVFAPIASPDTLRHYVVQVVLDDLVTPLLQNGQFAAITVSRVLNTEDPQDEADSIYLSALGFTYRKSECPLA